MPRVVSQCVVYYRTVPPSRAPRRHALEPVALHRRAAEHALFDGELGHVELCAVAQQREQNAAEAMGDRDDGHLVAALRAQACEVRMQRMIRPLRMVRGFTQYGAQRRAAWTRWVCEISLPARPEVHAYFGRLWHERRPHTRAFLLRGNEEDLDEVEGQHALEDGFFIRGVRVRPRWLIERGQELGLVPSVDEIVGIR